jgi:hypothetical protein
MKQPARTYTMWDELMASPTEPLALDKRTYQLSRMWQGLASIERDAMPSKDDWRVCSDAVNLLETLVNQGVMQDPDGLLPAAVAALAEAGQRHLRVGAAIRLSAPGIFAIRSVLEDYADAIEQLPARVVIHAHRATEKRIQDIVRGRARAHDVEVTNL